MLHIAPLLAFLLLQIVVWVPITMAYRQDMSNDLLKTNIGTQPSTGNPWDAKITDWNGIALLTSDDDLDTLPTFDIYFEDKPNERWTNVAASFKEKFGTGVLDAFGKELGENGPKIVSALRSFGPRVAPWDSEMDAEIEGYAAAAGESTADIKVLQVIYAMMSACTSIVAQNEDGTTSHGRLLDFDGAPVLRKRTFQANWYQNHGDKKPLFRSTQFAGLVGVLTGSNQGFAASINQRSKPDITHGGIKNVIESWWKATLGGKNVQYLLRETLKDCPDFDCAVSALSSNTLISPVYYTISGPGHGQGVVIERGRTSKKCYALTGFEAPKGIECEESQDGWFVAVSNADAVSEANGALAFSRRNMASEALRIQAQICEKTPRTDNCRGTLPVLDKILKWGFVTQHGAVYRTLMQVATDEYKSILVKNNHCGGQNIHRKLVEYCEGDESKLLSSAMSTIGNHMHDLGKSPGLMYLVKRVCPSKLDMVDTCMNSWKTKAKNLALNYMDPRDEILNRQNPSLMWKLRSLIECPCPLPE